MRFTPGLGLLLALSACGGSPSEQWLSLGRDWQGDRFSPLTKINAATASELGFAWEYGFRSRRGRVEHEQEAMPLVVDGVLASNGMSGFGDVLGTQDVAASEPGRK